MTRFFLHNRTGESEKVAIPYRSYRFCRGRGPVTTQNFIPQTLEVTLAIGANWRRLLAAILAQAAVDAQSDDPAVAGPARRWLTEAGIEMIEWLEISPVMAE